jgi:uncharacterized protein DUF4438
VTSAINESELLVTALAGAVTSPSMTVNPYEIAASGTPFVPVGAGGVCYNVKVGMSALDWAADQVEPGLSMANPDGPSNEALSLYACVGNRVVLRSGAAAGAEGVVTGKHEAFMGYKHVLVHVADDVLERVAPGDSLVVRAHGRGLRVPDVPAVACHSLSPRLWSAWAPTMRDGRLSARVTRVLPPEVVGLGSGRASAITSVALQRGVPDAGSSDALDGLRLGDLIAVRDWDATYYTGYREGALTVGVVACGDSPVAGNGPGVTLLVTAPDGLMEPMVDASANLVELLALR